MATEYDLNEVLGGNVDSVEAKFADMTDATLDELFAIESAGQKRPEMLDAITAEMERRAGTANAAAPATFTKEQVDKLLADQATRLGVTHTAEIAKLKAAQPKVAKAGSKGPAKPLAIAAKAPRLDFVALGGVTKIVFVDQDGRPLPDVPELAFAGDDYRASGGRMILDRDIDFPETMPGRDVSGAFVLDGDGSPVGYARLVSPFRVGGGANARLSRSTLSFEGGAVAVPA